MSFGAKRSISAEVYSSLGETPETASTSPVGALPTKFASDGYQPD